MAHCPMTITWIWSRNQQQQQQQQQQQNVYHNSMDTNNLRMDNRYPLKYQILT